MQLHTADWFDIKNRRDALQRFAKTGKEQNVKKQAKTAVTRTSLYDSGMVWRSDQLYQELNRLPTLPEPDKNQLIFFYNRCLALC